MHLLGIKRMTLALLAPYTIIFELYRILNVLFFLSIYYYIVHLESVCLLNTQSSWYEFVFGQRGVMTLLIKDLICPLSYIRTSPSCSEGQNRLARRLKQRHSCLTSIICSDSTPGVGNVDSRGPLSCRV